MKNTSFTFLLFCLIFSFSVQAQIGIKNYEGQWEGTLSNKHIFNFSIDIEDLGQNTYKFSISNSQFKVEKKVQSTAKNHLQFTISKGLKFTGNLNKKTGEIDGFINSGIYLYHTKLVRSNTNKYHGKWHLFLLQELISTAIFLSIENVEGKKFDAYPFFGDKRFAGTWCMNAKKNKNQISFQDFRTGLSFKGTLEANTILLQLLIANKTMAAVRLKKSKKEWVFKDLRALRNNNNIPTLLADGLPVNKDINLSGFNQMEDSIYANKSIHTHSILISRKNQLIYEKYFSGFTAATLHDQRSASKSISSALIGIAIDKKMIKSVNDPIYKYLPKEYEYTQKGTKSNITLKNLLTMSSGLDAVDFGTKRTSKASEQQYQNSPNWLKTVLEAPMIHKPGRVASYGSANPYLLGVALNEVHKTPLELFIHASLFAPLQINNYVIQKDMTGIPYFGGGMYLTPRDMLKFGQLYLNEGSWYGRRVISKKWVKNSFENHTRLQNVKEKNQYGYLWWHNTYTLGATKIKSFEARGAGGQYIFVLPSLETVVVITSGNFRNGKFQYPETILEKYILPALTTLKNK